MLGQSLHGDTQRDPQHDVRGAASAGLVHADRNPRNATAQAEASALLFRVVEDCLVRAALDRVGWEDPPTTEALLALEDRIEPELAAEILALCSEGRERALLALELEPRNVAAQHYLATHAVMSLQAVSTAKALFRVGGAVRAMKRTIELDAAYDDGAPLLLLGRFRDRAPWPHQDRTEAVPLLEQAVEMRPTPSRLLFLGDALFGLGTRYEEALAAWRAAAMAEVPRSAFQEQALASFYRGRALARLAREER